VPEPPSLRSLVSFVSVIRPASFGSAIEPFPLGSSWPDWQRLDFLHDATKHQAATLMLHLYYSTHRTVQKPGWSGLTRSQALLRSDASSVIGFSAAYGLKELFCKPPFGHRRMYHICPAKRQIQFG